MKCMLFYLFAIIIISSCNSKSTDKVDDLLELDSMVHRHSSLSSFTSLKLYTKTINDIAVCDSLNSKCRVEEKNYAFVLKQLGISVDSFILLISKMDHIGFIKYYRYGGYSVWVENGAFGDISGYVINHNPLVSEVKSFELEDRYHIGMGKRVQENVYYFSSNFK